MNNRTKLAVFAIGCLALGACSSPDHGDESSTPQSSSASLTLESACELLADPHSESITVRFSGLIGEFPELYATDGESNPRYFIEFEELRAEVVSLKAKAPESLAEPLRELEESIVFIVSNSQADSTDQEYTWLELLESTDGATSTCLDVDEQEAHDGHIAAATSEFADGNSDEEEEDNAERFKESIYGLGSEYQPRHGPEYDAAVAAHSEFVCLSIAHPDSLLSQGPYTFRAVDLLARTVEEGHNRPELAGEYDLLLEGMNEMLEGSGDLRAPLADLIDTTGMVRDNLSGSSDDLSAPLQYMKDAALHLTLTCLADDEQAFSTAVSVMHDRLAEAGLL